MQAVAVAVDGDTVGRGVSAPFLEHKVAQSEGARGAPSLRLLRLLTLTSSEV